MKLIPTLHPSGIMRGNWAELSLLAADLKKAINESGSGVVVRDEVRYTTAPTLRDADKILRTDDQRPLTVDIETTRAGDIWCCGATRESHEAYCFPWIRPFIDRLGDALRSAQEVVAQNAAFDLPRLAKALGKGIRGADAVVTGRWFDTMAAHALVEPDHPHGLGHLGSVFSDLIPWKGDMEDSPETYNCKDVDVTARAAIELKRIMREEGVEELYNKHVGPLLPILCEMKRVGMRVDRERMTEVWTELKAQETPTQERLNAIVFSLPCRQSAITALMKEADQLEADAAPLMKPGTKREGGKMITQARRKREAAEALKRINTSSPKAMCRLLYEELELPVQKKDGKVTSNDDALAELIRRTNHPALEPIRELRELIKLRGTYLEYTEDVLHSELMLHGTGTGRLSSREPNLQNIPSRSAWAPKIKSIFVPSERGWEFTEADYSQIERRIQAWDSRDPALLEAFEKKIDVHTHAASRIYGISMEKVTKDQRYLAKRAVYGESYGMGYLKFSRELATEGVYVTPGEAKRLLSGLSVAYPTLRDRRDQLVRLANAEHRLRNCFGRFRYFFADAYGNAMNFLPQSTAADVIMSKMVRLAEELPEPARMLLQVHDSILVEAPRDLRERVVECLRDVMQSPVPEMDGWSCPIDLKLGGKDWSFKAN